MIRKKKVYFQQSLYVWFFFSFSLFFKVYSIKLFVVLIWPWQQFHVWIRWFYPATDWFPLDERYNSYGIQIKLAKLPHWGWNLFSSPLLDTLCGESSLVGTYTIVLFIQGLTTVSLFFRLCRAAWHGTLLLMTPP